MKTVKLIVLDPQHFHAALLQKKMYEQISPVVHVYAPSKEVIEDYMGYISTFNKRAENPTNWQSRIYAGYDFLEKMTAEKAGDLVVLAGNNKKRIQYIQEAVDAGLHILADKPLCIDKKGFNLLEKAFSTAQEKRLLLYDIMTERSEITNILQKELSRRPLLFGSLVKGSSENPAVIESSVHHFFKIVNGAPIKRPGWYFDTGETGEGIVDVTSHLIDLAHWTCFPQQVIDYKKDIELISAGHWPTEINRQQFKKVTGLSDFPDYLQPYLKDDILYVYANGHIDYKIFGYHIKVKIEWPFEASADKGDRHYSLLRGTNASLIIRQDGLQPELYVEAAEGKSVKDIFHPLQEAVRKLQQIYPDLEIEQTIEGWHVIIPEKYRLGHEAHFAEVVKRYLQYLNEGNLPKWEIPNMLAKYFITTSAAQLTDKN